MNTNNTPEADKAERMAYSGEYMVPTEVARKLERERDEARDAFVIATDQMVIAQGKAREVWRERNEWAAMCGRYKQERDEQLKDLEK